MREKFVFYVHSNITIYLSFHYIENYKLNSQDIIILYDRVSYNDLEILPGRKYLFSNEFKNFNINWKNFFHSYRDLNNFYKREINANYTLLVPHLYLDNLQLFASYKKCKRIIYIEEGDLSYLTEESINNRFYKAEFKNNYFRKIFSFKMLFEKKPFPSINKTEEVICLSEESFKFKIVKKHIYDFKNVFLNKHLKFNENFDECVIFLLDPYYPEDDNEKNDYFSTLNKTFIYIKKNISNKVYFKPHPVIFTKKGQIEVILEIATKNKLECQIIDYPVELIITNYTNVKLVSHVSSLIRYGCYAKIEVIFWGYDLIKKYDLHIESSWVDFLKKNINHIRII